MSAVAGLNLHLDLRGSQLALLLSRPRANHNRKYARKGAASPGARATSDNGGSFRKQTGSGGSARVQRKAVTTDYWKDDILQDTGLGAKHQAGQQSKQQLRLPSLPFKLDIHSRFPFSQGQLCGQPSADNVQQQSGSSKAKPAQTSNNVVPRVKKVPRQAEQQGLHAALQLVRQRLYDGSMPGKRRDDFKLGLVIEGGGMRGAVSAGGLHGLYELGLRDVWDAAYGSSAGAINGTYFLSRQVEGVYIYTQDISNKQFCDLSRLVSRDPKARPALDLDFLLGHVMQHVKPLDWDAVVKSSVPLKVVASSLDTLGPVILEDFSSAQDLLQCLKASAKVPVVAGGPLLHRGQRLVDAAVFEPIPFRSAIADGCTHVVVLCSRPPFQGDRVKKLVSEAVYSAVKRTVLSPTYMRAAWAQELANMTSNGISEDDMLLEALRPDAHDLPYFRGAHVFPIYPGRPADFSPVAIDVPTLEAGLQEGRRAVIDTFSPVLQSPPAETLRRTHVRRGAAADGDVVGRTADWVRAAGAAPAVQGRAAELQEAAAAGAGWASKAGRQARSVVVQSAAQQGVAVAQQGVAVAQQGVAAAQQGLRKVAGLGHVVGSSVAAAVLARQQPADRQQ